MYSRAKLPPLPFDVPTEEAARYARAAETFRILSNSDRLRIVMLLEGGDISVGALQDQTELPQPTVSRHLAILARAGLVTSTRNGRFIRYSLTDEAGLMRILKHLL